MIKYLSKNRELLLRLMAYLYATFTFYFLTSMHWLASSDKDMDYFFDPLTTSPLYNFSIEFSESPIKYDIDLRSHEFLGYPHDTFAH